MQQDAHTVVREAQRHAQTDLESQGRVRPAVFMLVTRDPETGTALPQAAAIGSIADGPDVDRADWFDGIRAEAGRLGATVVAVCMGVEAEVEDGKRVPAAVVHVEDEAGVELLMAPVARSGEELHIGAYTVLTDVDPHTVMGIDPPLLSQSSRGSA
jgi:hypothetical protein